MRAASAVTVLVVASSLLTGCGCEGYKSHTYAEGIGFPTASPDQTTRLALEWTSVFAEDGFFDATPRPDTIATFCLAAERDGSPVLSFVLDYSLQLGARQTGVSVPNDGTSTLAARETTGSSTSSTSS